jgi:DNA-binding NtrC family response regulator
MLALLRHRRAWPVLVGKTDEAVAAVRDASTVVAVLHGSLEFCQPFFDCFRELQLKQAAPPLLILAAQSSEAFAVASLRAGAADYLAEPLDLAAFDRSIARWIERDSEQPPDASLTGGEVLVGNSAAMQALRLQIRRVASTDCNVLITGETGTGKELVAQLIHQNSGRGGHPLICINCAAIPDSLLESELFGYERGAFTGASLTNQGKLMTANRGSVFFDEIGDMSSFAQAKILRAIETKEVQRLGATRKYNTDIRILAATHHNLDELASADTFRRDLYFRLNVGRIHLPPLRERKSDIGDLCERMVFDLNRRLGRRIEGLTSGAIRRLVQHDWPGNVRELKNVMERAFITRDGGAINDEDLSHVLPQRPELSTCTDQQAPKDELRGLREALFVCNGNKSKAAERLNCSRMTLYRKMAKYGIGDEAANKPSSSNVATDVALARKRA